MLIQGQVGAVIGQDGSQVTARQGRTGELIFSELHGRFYEQASRGTLFSTGTTTVVAGAATHGTATGLSATLATAVTGTPMLGVWNPPTSGVNVVLLQAMLHAFINTVTTPTPFGGLVWATSPGNGAISTGLTPWNRKLLSQTGSFVKGFAGATALTGLTNVLSGIEVADLASGGNLAYGTIGNTTVHPPLIMTQNFDGQMIVPPGAVFALYNTTATTTFSFTGRLLWEEVPV